MKDWRRPVLLLLLLALPACRGAGSSTGSAPTAPTSTVSSISINGPNIIFVGSSATYTASASFSDGSTGVTVCAWTGDNDQIARVDARTASVTGLHSGEITIACDADRAHGRRTVRVLPNYAGQWNGSYIVERCEESDLPAATFCGSFPREWILPLSARLSQERDIVTGTFTLGTIEAQQTTGLVSVDGALRMSIVHTGPATFTISSNWTLNSERVGQISGTMLQTWSSTSGEGRVFSRILTAAREARPLLASLLTTND